MLTNQELLTLLKKVVGQDGTANDSFLQQLINLTHKSILGARDWSFTEATWTGITTTAQQTIQLPYDYRKLSTYSIMIGNAKYTPREIQDPVTFDKINNRTTTITSNFPRYFHIRNGNILNFPAISSSGLTITIEYYRLPKDMGVNGVTDYTTGTVTSIANGATAMVLSGTALTTAMIGRYIRITNDGYWYKIAAVPTSTSLTLDKPYAGITIVADTQAFTIAELPLIPEEFEDMLWLRPASIYYMMKTDEVRAQYYMEQYKDMLVQLKEQYSAKTGQVVTNDSIQFIDPNTDPRSIVIT